MVSCTDDPLALLPGPDICHAMSEQAIVMSGQAFMMPGQVIRAPEQTSSDPWSQRIMYRYTNVDVSVFIAQQSP